MLTEQVNFSLCLGVNGWNKNKNVSLAGLFVKLHSQICFAALMTIKKQHFTSNCLVVADSFQ